MSKHCMLIIIAAMAALCLVSGAWAGANNPAVDITKESLAGPGSIAIKTKHDILMSFGASVRIIPTIESAWDFGLSDKATHGFLGGQLPPNLFQAHFNEAGWIKEDYIRAETRLLFNALPKDRKWSFYAALEFDKALDTASVDARGGRTNNDSNFGLERLNISYALPANMRLHAGWDVWHLDAMDGASMVYADDNPGFWLKGDYDNWGFNIGYFSLADGDFQISPGNFADASDNDRSMWAGYLTLKPLEGQKFKLFYAYDRIRSVPIRDFANYLSKGAMGVMGRTPDTDSHHLGIQYNGNWGPLGLMLEGVYQFGQAEDTGLRYKDYDINAYALACDLSYDFKQWLGFSMKPHLGALYTSGDDNANDDELSGYQGIENAQRFSKYWGGENTIIGDTNLILGSLLYGYIPELYGNGTPIFTGGLQNTAGIGGGRGDNPGMLMISVGLSTAPKKFLSYRSNVNVFSWNEDFLVYNMVDPSVGPSRVEGEYVGTEWDNELTFAASKHSFVKGQASFFFPGETIENITKAMGASQKADDTAIRLAIEFILNF